MALDVILFTKHTKKESGECRARSDCTYVQADLALHSSLNNFMIANGRVRVKTKVPRDC